jgi:hypothetical protein
VSNMPCAYMLLSNALLLNIIPLPVRCEINGRWLFLTTVLYMNLIRWIIELRTSAAEILCIVLLNTYLIGILKWGIGGK